MTTYLFLKQTKKRSDLDVRVQKCYYRTTKGDKDWTPTWKEY